MAWNTPTTVNTPETKVTITTFDEIAENQVYLKERADKVDSDLGQELNTDSSPNFENITLTGMTGTVEGRIESLDEKVGQSLNADDAVTFASVTTGDIYSDSSQKTITMSPRNPIIYNKVDAFEGTIATGIIASTTATGYVLASGCLVRTDETSTRRIYTISHLLITSTSVAFYGVENIYNSGLLTTSGLVSDTFSTSTTSGNEWTISISF